MLAGVLGIRRDRPELAPPDKNGVYAALLAVNAIDALGPWAAPLHELLRTMSAQDPAAVGRANGYVARLQERILGERKPPAAPAKKKRPAKKATAQFPKAGQAGTVQVER